MRHTAPVAGTLDSTSWGYADDNGVDEELYSTLEHTNHGDSKLCQQGSAETNNSSGPTKLIERRTAHSSYSKSDFNPK